MKPTEQIISVGPELHTCRPIRGKAFRVPDPSPSSVIQVKPMALILRVHLCLALYKSFPLVRQVIYLAVNRLCQSVGASRIDASPTALLPRQLSNHRTRSIPRIRCPVSKVMLSWRTHFNSRLRRSFPTQMAYISR